MKQWVDIGEMNHDFRNKFTQFASVRLFMIKWKTKLSTIDDGVARSAQVVSV